MSDYVIDYLLIPALAISSACAIGLICFLVVLGWSKK